MKLTFQIMSVDRLVPALKVNTVFSQRGGIIGSDHDADWCIQDLDGTIPGNVARVVVIDDRFTIECFRGAEIFVNGATSSILPGRPVILSDKDTLRIGMLECRVETGLRNTEPAQQVQSISSFAMAGGHGRDALVINGEYEEASTMSSGKRNSDGSVDPIQALDGQSTRIHTVDPVAALDRERVQEAEEITSSRGTDGYAQSSVQDGTNRTNASVMTRKIRRDDYGFEEVADDFADSKAHRPEIDAATIDLNHRVDHVALRPLSRALGMQLGDMTSTEAADVLSDIGGALRAAVSGINEIYKSREGHANRFPLTTLHLHAVEDNPLRFARDTDEALHAMFAKRGTVHLSAPAAMQEAVDHFAAHQQATERAIDKALDAVMAALMPHALERRFGSYAPNQKPKSGTEQDAWCWDMYKAYFSELKSQRQKGLQMLFWEVFQHEYQGIMRNHELTGGQGDEQ